MKTTINNFKLNRNGKVILSSLGEIQKSEFLGQSLKENGIYYFYSRKQNGKFIYNQ